MKIALIGYGKMGKIVETVALEKGHEIVFKGKELDSAIDQADVCIDFSHPSCVMEHIKMVSKAKKNLIVGTTGWYDQMEYVKSIVKESQIGFLYAPNFSIGVFLFLKIVEEAATLFHPFDEYDVGAVELHHSKKADSPSGTAKLLVNALLEKMERKQNVEINAVQGQIDPHTLHVASLRCGSIPGTHTVLFDSPADTITLTHQARNREGFARGALFAAEWLEGKKGFYSIDDLLLYNSLGEKIR